MAFWLFIVALVAGVLLCGWLGRWILRPLGNATRSIQAPRRFQLSDLIWLMVLLQCAMAITMYVFGDRGGLLLWIVLILLTVSAALLWAGSLSTLSQAGIHQPKRRAVFVLGLMPAVLITMMAALGVVLSLVPAVEVLLLGDLVLLRYGVLPLVSLLFVVPASIGLHWLTRWIVMDIRKASGSN